MRASPSALEFQTGCVSVNAALACSGPPVWRFRARQRPRRCCSRRLGSRRVMPAGSAGTGLAGIPHGKIFRTGYNWFTGDGMVHGVRLCGGDALWYRNRWVDSKVTAGLLGRRAPREARRSPLHGPSANTNVIGFGGRTMALIEGGLACAELSDELDTIDVCDFDGTIRGGYTGHPILDPVTGELHAVSYHFGRGNTVEYTVVGPDGKLRRRLPIESAAAR